MQNAMILFETLWIRLSEKNLKFCVKLTMLKADLALFSQKVLSVVPGPNLLISAIYKVVLSYISPKKKKNVWKQTPLPFLNNDWKYELHTP